jgi:hypothetical protein
MSSDGRPAPVGVRLAELVAVLSLASDLGMGQPMEHAMRQCLIALRLGDHVGLDQDQRESLYYVSLIGWVGCHVDAYEQAKWFGDDLALKGDSLLRDMSGLTPLAFMAATWARAVRRSTGCSPRPGSWSVGSVTPRT